MRLVTMVLITTKLHFTFNWSIFNEQIPLCIDASTANIICEQRDKTEELLTVLAFSPPWRI